MNGDGNPFRLVSYEHAAELMDVDVATVKRLVREGKLPVHRVSPGCPRIVWWAYVQQVSREFGLEVNVALAPVAQVQALRH